MTFTGVLGFAYLHWNLDNFFEPTSWINRLTPFEVTQPTAMTVGGLIVGIGILRWIDYLKLKKEEKKNIQQRNGL